MRNDNCIRRLMLSSRLNGARGCWQSDVAVLKILAGHSFRELVNDAISNIVPSLQLNVTPMPSTRFVAKEPNTGPNTGPGQGSGSVSSTVSLEGETSSQMSIESEDEKRDMGSVVAKLSYILVFWKQISSVILFALCSRGMPVEVYFPHNTPSFNDSERNPTWHSR